MDANDAQAQITEVSTKESWTFEDATRLVGLYSQVVSSAAKFRSLVGQMESANPDPRGAAALKIGIAKYLLCRFDEALTVLSSGTDNKDRRFVQGLCYKHIRQYERAGEEFERAKDRGWDADEIDLQLVEVDALRGEYDKARQSLSKLEGRLGQTAHLLYLRGLIAELEGWGDEACEAYEKALELDPQYHEATFRLAYFYDLHGDEDRAVELYHQCIAHPPVHANALLNLAVLYEDAADYDAAAACLRRVLECNPTHARAQLFLKDVEASRTMYFDEDQARRIAKRNAVLDIPVTDFELSVRARNCLKKMNIRCLGDLVMTTETELLSYKNFGETSLREIREMLKAKGLHLGQGLEEVGMSYEPADGGGLISSAASKTQAMSTPLDRVEFSVRARKAIDGLNIATLGELASKTEAELLACKNFGQSSLNEVRQRLGEYDLRLRDPD